jgi:hypothetical protein
VCPADGFVPGGSLCRAAGGECDAAESCTGFDPFCPGDGLAPPGTICRPAVAECDVLERCTGTSPSCPPDGYLGPTVCRPSTAACDPAERCPGTSPFCPGDVSSCGGGSCLPGGSACSGGAGLLPSSGGCCAGLFCCPAGFPLPAPTCLASCPRSDRNVKEGFAEIDRQEVLETVASLPITTWSYIDDPDHARHMGPMAQDFAAAFGLGASDRTIFPIDADGVSLAAIQALYERVRALEEQNRALLEEVRRSNEDGPP